MSWLNEINHNRRQQPRRQRPRRLPNRTWSEIYRKHEYLLSIGFSDYMEENLTPLLEEYNWEKMDPKIRWEQEQLKLALIEDEKGQIRQIELLQKSQEKEQQQQRNYDELVQLQ